MNARERIYLVLLALIFGAAAVLVGGAALSLYPIQVLRTSINAVYGHLVYALLAVFLLSLAVYLLLISMRRQKTVETITQQGLLGEVRISFKAVENLVLKATRAINGVREVKTRIVYDENGLVIFLRAVTVPDQNIPQLTGELQTAVKEYVENATGCTVAEIKVLIENVATDTVKAAREKEGVNVSKNDLRQFLGENWGKVLGGIIGLLIGLAILLFGFWRSILLFFCIAAGVYIGRFFDRHEVLQSILQRFWPD